MSIDRILRVLAVFCAVLVLGAFAAPGAGAQGGASAPAVGSLATPAPDARANGYVLGIGDKVHINIFGQKDLDGDYMVDSNGNVQVPLIGEIKAAGRSVTDFQSDVTAKLADGFLINPSVSVEVANYRPFYIIGEVNKPGEYPYVNGMSILNAVALAGGFTFRADDSEIYIRRNGSSKEVEFPADETTKINPGDIVRVPERFF